jgi:hypothetical protein
MAETLTHRATLKGHRGWVTSIATPLDPNADVILSASRCDLGGVRRTWRVLLPTAPGRRSSPAS